VKHFLGGCDVDDTRGELYSLFSLSLSGGIVQSLLSFSVFLFQTFFRGVFRCFSSKWCGEVRGDLWSARDTRSAQWETSIGPRRGLWLRFHPTSLRCSLSN